MFDIDLQEWATRFKKMRKHLSRTADEGLLYSVALNGTKKFNQAAAIMDSPKIMYDAETIIVREHRMLHCHQSFERAVGTPLPALEYKLQAPEKFRAGYIAFNDKNLGIAFMRAMKAKGHETVMFRTETLCGEKSDSGFYEYDKKLTEKLTDHLIKSLHCGALIESTTKNNRNVILGLGMRLDPIVWIRPRPKL